MTEAMNMESSIPAMAHASRSAQGAAKPSSQGPAASWPFKQQRTMSAEGAQTRLADTGIEGRADWERAPPKGTELTFCDTGFQNHVAYGMFGASFRVLNCIFDTRISIMPDHSDAISSC